MALVLGTNCGFVTVAPTGYPAAGGGTTADGRKMVFKDTSPATAIKVIEMGWRTGDATEVANFEVGLYAADGASGEAGTRLYVDDTNAKGTTSGWKVVTGLDWGISPSTIYWLAVQLDDTATSTYINRESSGGAGYDIATDTTLTDPFGGGALSDSDGILAIYAVYEAAPPAPVPPKVDNYPVQTGSVNIRKKDTLSQRAYLSRGVT